MAGVPVDKSRVREALERNGARTVALMRSVTEPDRTAIGYWTTSDVSTHLAQNIQAVAALARGELSPVARVEDMNPHWNRLVEDEKDQDPRSAAALLEESLAGYLKSIDDKKPGEIVRWHAGIDVPVEVLACISLSEFLLHGFDIAKAEAQPWDISQADAALSIDGLSYMLPHYVNEEAARGSNIRFRLQIRGGSTFDLKFRGADLTVEPPLGSPDCKISADPRAYLLVGYGRIGRAVPILTGKIVSYGRKPWLGLALTKLIANP
jgi:uncharacterized protein (TIGR03083 family)